jgi:hypothetical protein
MCCGGALAASAFFYINDTRTKDMPDGKIYDSSELVTIFIDSCHVEKNSLFASGWIAVKNHDQLGMTYISSNVTKGAMNSQSNRGYDVSKVLHLPDESVVRFSSFALLKNKPNENVRLNIVSKSNSGKLYGGTYVCK